jgi:DNA-binding NarL/FixJ family response regulator
VCSLRILIVDDSAILRERIVRLLRAQMAPAVTGEAASGEQALDLIGLDAWDAVVLDVSLPGLSGLDVLDALQTLAPALPVVMLSVDLDLATIQRSFGAGALGYVAKENAPDELAPALRHALQGERYRCRLVRRAEVDQLTPPRVI